VRSVEEHLELGARIFGAEDSIIKPLLEEEKLNASKRLEYGDDKEKWATVIRQKYTPELWVAWHCQKDYTLTFYGVGVIAFARIFGITGPDPTRDRFTLVQLGAKIYGRDVPVIQEAWNIEEKKSQEKENLSKDPEKWKTFLSQKYSVSEWVQMGKASRQSIKIAGRDLRGISTVLGKKGLDPRNSVEDMVELGKIIYGRDIVENFLQNIV
jgi:hypothetical protein